MGGILPRLVFRALSFWFLPRGAVLGEGLVMGRRVGLALAYSESGWFPLRLSQPLICGVTACFLSSASSLEGACTLAVYPRHRLLLAASPPSPVAFLAERCEGRSQAGGDCWVRGPHLGPELFQTPSILPAHRDTQTWVPCPSFFQGLWDPIHAQNMHPPHVGRYGS